jgi:hypothetical protein
MPSIESIELKLLQLDASSFQRLGDEYFSQCAKINFKEFKPVGLAPGKRAPRKGTPDTLIRLNSGKYILIEYTTKVRGEKKAEFLKKLTGDLKNCLNPKLTGVSLNEIHTIILATNQIVGIKDRKEIIAAVKYKNVMIEFCDLHFWSQEVRRFSFLARTYLNLYSETKQVLSAKEFVAEYEFGGLSTPLSNKFLHRADELKNAIDAISSNQIYVLSGPPGVGKTKIALEAGSQYATSNDAEFYCLKDKGSWSLDDVRTYFFPDKAYVVFIDDANRHLKMLAHMINTLQEGLNVKLLLTVRDYALGDVRSVFTDLAPKIDEIKPFEDKDLIGIIAQVADFNRTAINRILELAKGNPRLALMAARIVKSTNTLQSVLNASGIFDEYYSSMLKQHKTLTETKYVKALGIISIFRSIDLGSPVLKKVLASFKIEPTAFLETIHQLEEMELLEIDEDLLRITEQNFQTYSFYKAFITERRLSLSTLFLEYFPVYSAQIKDITIAAVNAFGYENLFEALYGPLVGRLKKLTNDGDRLIFFEAFWFYCPTELFAFVNNHIDNLPSIVSNEKEELNSYYLTSKYFRLLIPFLDYNNENFIPALELLIEFTKKNPNHYKQLLDTVKGRITYDEQSYPAYTRPLKYLKLITTNWKKHAIYADLFFDSVNQFFYARFTIPSATHKRNTIALEQHSAILTTSLQKQRKLIWDFLNRKFSESPSRVVKVLSHYADHRIDLINKFIAFDAPLIFKIIFEKFDSSKLSHSLCVLSIDDLLRRFKVGIEMPESIKNKFLDSKTYQDYRMLSWSRDQERLDAKGDFQKYYEWKSKRLIKAFKSMSIDEIRSLSSNAANWHREIENHRTEGILNSLDVLANHFFSNGQSEFAWTILESIVDEGNSNSFVPEKALGYISSNKNTYKAFFELLENKLFKSSLVWYGAFLQNLEDVITEHQIKFLFSLIQKSKGRLYFDFYWLKKVQAIKQNIGNEVLSVFLRLWRDENARIYLGREFFIDSSQFSIDPSLLEEAYIMQYLTVEPYFDYNGESFKILIEANENFLAIFCKKIFGQKDFRGTQDASFIKGLSGNSKLPQLATQLLNFLGASDSLYPDDFYNSLNEAFAHTNLDFNKFLKGYLSKNAKNLKRAKLVAEIVDEVFKTQAPAFLKIFVQKNDNVEHFKEINWSTFGGFFGAQTNISQLYLSRWMNVKNVLKDFESIKYLPHRQFVDEMVYQYQIASRKEERELFLKKSFYDN